MSRVEDCQITFWTYDTFITKQLKRKMGGRKGRYDRSCFKIHLKKTLHKEPHIWLSQWLRNGFVVPRDHAQLVWEVIPACPHSPWYVSRRPCHFYSSLRNTPVPQSLLHLIKPKARSFRVWGGLHSLEELSHYCLWSLVWVPVCVLFFLFVFIPHYF